MKPINDIKSLLSKLRYQARPGMSDKVLGDMLTVFDQAQKTSSAWRRPNVWGIIMKSRMTQLAVAAVIIVVVLIGLTQSGGPIDGVSATFAGTLETMKGMPWVHVITESETSRGKEISECWTNFERHIHASTGTRGATTYIDCSENKEYSYSPRDPYSHKIKITPLGPIYDLLVTPDSPIDLITHELENAKEHGFTVTREKSALDGINVEVIRITHNNGESVLFRDIERDLLIRMDKEGDTMRTEETSKKSEGALSANSETEDYPSIKSTAQYKYKHLFDYPAQGPRDIYDLGAPRDAEIDNYCATGELADIFYEVRKRYRDAYEGFVAMVLASEVLDSSLPQEKIIMMRPEDESKPPFFCAGIRSLVWFHPSCFTLNTHSYNTTYEMLPANSKHEGLIGFKVFQIQKSRIKRTRIDEYWLDPEQDYLVMQHLRFEDHMNRYWDSTKRTMTLATKQTPDGQWYPSHISYEWEYSDDTGQHKQKIDKKIILKSGPVFADDDSRAEYIFRVE